MTLPHLWTHTFWALPGHRPTPPATAVQTRTPDLHWATSRVPLQARINHSPFLLSLSLLYSFIEVQMIHNKLHTEHTVWWGSTYIHTYKAIIKIKTISVHLTSPNISSHLFWIPPLPQSLDPHPSPGNRCSSFSQILLHFLELYINGNHTMCNMFVHWFSHLLNPQEFFQ